MMIVKKVLLVMFALSLGLSFGQHKPNLKMYDGNFESKTSQMKLKITNKEEGLFAQASGNPEFQIFSKTVHEFYGKAIDISFKFMVKEDSVIGVTAERMGEKFEFKRSK